jgi:hypothetical protein
MLIGSCSSGADGFTLSPIPVRSPGPGQVDARAALVAAIDATRDDYRYETTVTIDDAVTTQVQGSVAGGVRQSTIIADGRVIEYLQTRYERWVMGPAKRWVLTRNDPQRPALLDALTGPSEVGDADVAAGGDLVVDATYPGAALGVPGLEKVDVEVVISDGLVRHLRYEIPSGHRTAEVMTVISGVGEVGVISAPDLGGADPITR